jgi:hypothetical protein
MITPQEKVIDNDSVPPYASPGRLLLQLTIFTLSAVTIV